MLAIATLRPVLLLLLFIVVPIAELYVIIQVGSWIGVWPTLAILLGDALLGWALLRQQGRAAWRRFNAALEERRFPAREVADGVMVTVGGTLLLTPGFITDIVGLLLLLPPTRALIRGLLGRYLRRRFQLVGGTATWGYERGRGPGYRGRDAPYDLDGTAHEMPGNGAAPPDRADERERPPLPP
jgi:UPF0716 protein FxsA